MNGKISLIAMLVGVLVATTGSAYADHPQVEISITPSSQSECEADPCYVPSEVTVDSGGEVIWSNDGVVVTQILSGTLSDSDAGGIFDSGILRPGDMYSVMFDDPGVYSFFSPIQPWMKGSITVLESHDDSHDGSTESASHGHMDDTGDHMHTTIESEVPISVDIDADVEPEGGVNVYIMTEGWRWAPENVNTEHVPGEGHAHIYVDGEKINRVYGPYHYLGDLESGEHDIRVTLNANTHNDLTIDGVLVEASQTVTVKRSHDDHDNQAPVDASPSMAIEIIAHVDAKSGYNLQVIPTDFVFSAGHVNNQHVDGQGYARVSIDGNSHTRMYAEWLKMPSLEPGMHTILVGLNANDHSIYQQNGEPVLASVTVHVEDTDDKMDHGDKTASRMDHDSMEVLTIEDPSATGVLSDGTMVLIKADEPVAGQQSEIVVVFKGAEHVNYDIMVTQNGVDVLGDQDAHAMAGSGIHTTAHLSSADPLDITIVSRGYGMSEPYSGPIGETVTFTNVVPEFGVVAIVVLGIALVSTTIVFTRAIPRLWL